VIKKEIIKGRDGDLIINDCGPFHKNKKQRNNDGRES
jgi:hypothetical protein